MYRNRFHNEEDFGPRWSVGAPAVFPSAFVLCPVALPQGGIGQQCLWQQVYQLAYEQAQAVVRTSRLERLQVATPN